MKALILSALSLLSSLMIAKQKDVLEFRIGKFSYKMETRQKYLHDDNFNATFFVVVKKDNSKTQCTSFKLATRNDTIFIKGKFVVSKDALTFKQYYYYNKNLLSADSIETTFSPKKNGNLVLKQVIEFKNGKERIIKY